MSWTPARAAEAVGLGVLLACAAPAEDAPVLRGHVVIGPEVRSFEPCDGSPALWVIPDDELREATDALRRDATERVYAELRGTPGPAPETGFGADYAGALEVRELLRAAPSAESHGCDEDLADVAFRAAGNEPFWHVEVGPDGIVFREPGPPERRFEGTEARRDGAGWVYETSAPSALRLALAPGRCTDSMVGSWFGWWARLELDGRTLTGCAWEGDAAPR